MTNRMKGRHWPAIGAAVVALLGGVGAGHAQGSSTGSARAGAESGARPNIIFLFSDDHAAHALSAYREHLPYGARLPDTPGLDRLAASGMLFVNAFVTNSICAPSRATVLTGQYGHLNGVMTNHEPFHPTNVTFPRLLQSAGYSTALFGKWHLKSEPVGFDYYEVLSGQGPYYNPVFHASGAAPGDSVMRPGYTQDIITDRALAWLRARGSTGATGAAGAASGSAARGAPGASAPFLLMLHYNAPHRYWDPGPEQLGLYRDTMFAEPATFRDDGARRSSAFRLQEQTIGLDLFARDLKLEAPANLTAEQLALWTGYYDPENAEMQAARLTPAQRTAWDYQRYIKDYMRVVVGLDANVSRVLDFVEANGLASNTVVVYASDQGFFLGDHGWFDKRFMYEESLRTPLLVRWSGVVAPGSVNTDLVMNLDFAQTFLDLGGVDAPPTMQGASLVPLLKGERPEGWRDAIYYQYFEYPDWHMVNRQYGVRTARYKLIHYYELGEWELFDLSRDPNELNSVYGDVAYAPVVAELRTKLVRLRSQYRVPEQDPVPHRPFDALPGFRRPPELRGVPGTGPGTDAGTGAAGAAAAAHIH